LKNPKNSRDYINAITSDVNAKVCKVIVVIYSIKEIKKGIKSFLDSGGVPSQFITTQKLRGRDGGPNLSVITSILKQINAKLRQDLYRI
jgi:hypothetical protein